MWIVQICLDGIVGTLWMLAEGDVESLKVLQTILLLVTTTEIVSGQHLAKVLLSIKLYNTYIAKVYCLFLSIKLQAIVFLLYYTISPS